MESSFLLFSPSEQVEIFRGILEQMGMKTQAEDIGQLVGCLQSIQTNLADAMEEVRYLMEQIQPVEEPDMKAKYGAGVSIQNVGKDQNSIDSIGAGTAGTGNVVIASNILEQMANAPEKAAYYEKKIQDYFNYSLPQTQAFMAAVGHKITSSGVIIHEDGTVTYYLSGEESPEKKAQVEAEQKAKQEKKAAQRQENLKRSQEAAEERRPQMEIAYRKQMMAEVLANHTLDAGKVTYTSTSETMGPAIAAYERNIMEAAGILK